MNLEETRKSLKKVYEDKLSKVYAQVLKGKVDTKEDSYAPIYKVEDIILEYLDCGGIIESGSSFEFTEKVVEQCGVDMKRLLIIDFLNIRNSVAGSLTYDEAVERNSQLTLEELRSILDIYADIKMRTFSDLGDRLDFMKQQVDLGSVLQLEPIYLKSKQYGSIEEIKANPDYTSLYIEILDKSEENLDMRNKERQSETGKNKTSIDPEIQEEIDSWLIGEDKTLQNREAKLSSLKAEEKTIAEAEALMNKQNDKEGQNIGE